MLGGGDGWRDTCATFLFLGMSLGRNPMCMLLDCDKNEFVIGDKRVIEVFTTVTMSNYLGCKLRRGYQAAICGSDSSGAAFLDIFAAAYMREKTFVDTTQSWQRLPSALSPMPNGIFMPTIRSYIVVVQL